MQNRYGNWNDNNFFICAAITNLLHLLVLCVCVRALSFAMNGNRRCTCITSKQFARFAKSFRIFEAFEPCTNSPPKCLQKCHNVSRSLLFFCRSLSVLENAFDRVRHKQIYWLIHTECLGKIAFSRVL